MINRKRRYYIKGGDGVKHAWERRTAQADGRCCKRLHMLFASFSPASHTAYGQKPYIYAVNENTGICNLPQTRAQPRCKTGAGADKQADGRQKDAQENKKTLYHEKDFISLFFTVHSSDSNGPGMAVELPGRNASGILLGLVRRHAVEQP